MIYEASDEEITVEGDKNRIFQVISNLIGNAFKFTTRGSVGYGYRRKGNEIEFYVSDTGIGIQTDKLAKVFERFVKVNTFAQGTGLGLSICKTIIERFGRNHLRLFGSGERNDFYLYPASGKRQKGNSGGNRTLYPKPASTLPAMQKQATILTTLMKKRTNTKRHKQPEHPWTPGSPLS
mgnify:CR=1 FL=1